MAGIEHPRAGLPRHVEDIDAELIREEVGQRGSCIKDAAERKRLIELVITKQCAGAGLDLLDTPAQGGHEQVTAGAERWGDARAVQAVTPHRRAREEIVGRQGFVIGGDEHHGLGR